MTLHHRFSLSHRCPTRVACPQPSRFRSLSHSQMRLQSQNRYWVDGIENNTTVNAANLGTMGRYSDRALPRQTLKRSDEPFDLRGLDVMPVIVAVAGEQVRCLCRAKGHAILDRDWAGTPERRILPPELLLALISPR